jgi:TPR repeat protein
MAVRALLAGACAASIACAAHAQRANPILAPEQPWGFGFSLRPPAGAGWYSLAKSRTGAAFGRRIESQTHTLVGAVHSAREARPFASPETRAAELRARRARNLDPARFRLLEVDERRDDLDGAWCTRYRLDAEERLPRATVLRIRGRSCVHPAAPDLLVDLSISERGLPGETDDRARAQAGSFLDSLRFVPIARSAGLLEAENLSRDGAPEEAARRLEALAAQGDPATALRLARAYDSGRGVPADAARAERLYRLAAAAGEVDALYNLGVFHDKARGGARDVEEAMRWFLRAADQRDAQAQLNLGILFYKGDGVPVDHGQARAWLELAADNGNARARDLLGTLEFRPDPWYGLPVKPTVLIDPP